MDKITLARSLSVVVGVVATLTLVSTHPYLVGVLGTCAGVYILAPTVLR